MNMNRSYKSYMVTRVTILIAMIGGTCPVFGQAGGSIKMTTDGNRAQYVYSVNADGSINSGGGGGGGGDFTIAAFNAAFGTAGTADSQVMSVQGISGGTALPVSVSGVATSAKQDTQITAEQAILAKIIAAPSTEAKQDTGNTSLATIATNTGNISNPTATTVVSTALEASHVLKASAGTLVSLQVFSSRTTAQFILVMNSATVPADGAVALLLPPIPIPANGYVSVNFQKPLTASTGISVSNSSTGTFSKTIGSADCAFTAQVQ